MGSYSVTIQLDNAWIDNFNKTGMKLCMAKATKDSSGKEYFNVIAKTVDSVQPQMTITWVEEYKIEATAITFSKGAQISGTAGAKDINFGQTYQIQSWNKTQVFMDTQNVEKDSFGFANNIPCSIMLSMKDGNSFVPVYISEEVVIPGMTTLTPIPKVVFWFQKTVASQTMIVNTSGTPWYVTPTAGSNSTIKYDKNGVWSQVLQ
ncbi:hypothetical protein PFICI_06274 [Pestalotiopsis fici W106-1]|uniref:Uncharacterized protein n=1 Tax=Pestalotiopsis fici (strain W106-1 / CGMCC3.15140) TaxID=1229662 RepID=W3X7B9_PESFW|nr:uncharacterized protein PFICI_06274 [Pestalotiopsis fici W106-1]ETS81272.1 hypothetical protein PFICI_06274 [Pestalotiopsis fici W106-1]